MSTTFPRFTKATMTDEPGGIAGLVKLEEDGNAAIFAFVRKSEIGACWPTSGAGPADPQSVVMVLGTHAVPLSQTPAQLAPILF